MIEIVYLKEKGKIKIIPKEVQEIIERILQILDAEYSSIINKHEDEGDFEELKMNTYINFKEVIAEYVDNIVCSNGEIYTNSLILCNSDYAISLIIPLDLTPQNLKDYMVD